MTTKERNLMLRSLPHARLHGWRAVPLLAVAALLTVAATANATIFTPTTGAQLQTAITNANTNPGPDTIRIPSGTTLQPTAPMLLTDTSRTTITASHSNDAAADKAVISGVAIAPTAVSAITIAVGADVAMHGFTFTQSVIDDGFGAIQNDGTLTLDGMQVSGANAIGVRTSNGSTTRITNSCICDNLTQGVSGGGTNTIINSTIADNTGDGLHVSGLTLRNSIVSNLDTGAPRNCLQLPLVSTANIVTDDTCGTVGVTITNPGLQFVDWNGGPTDTKAIPATSPAINAADPAFCPTTDQRFFVRPAGAGCDVGSYEESAAKDTTPPACPGPGTIVNGPPKQQLITLTDGGSGLGPDAVLLEETTITNGTINPITPFASPFRSPAAAPAPSNSGQTVGATKTNQVNPTVWSFTARDWAGNTKLCI
jgi:hypothetical protein